MDPEVEGLRSAEVSRIYDPAPQELEAMQGEKLLQARNVLGGPQDLDSGNRDR